MLRDKYVLLETSGMHGRYRIVHNPSDFADGDPVFAFEYRTLDHMDKESWRPVDLDDRGTVRHMLTAFGYELAHLKAAAEAETPPEGDVDFQSGRSENDER